MDDQQLHDLVRDSLRASSSDADTTPSAVARVAPSRRPRRPRRALWAVGGAAVAVAATVTAVALAGEHVPRPDGDRPPAAETGDLPATSEWRTESWKGLTVSVPADWGYGAAPVDRRAICSDRADQPGYVGRPLYLTDACEAYQPGSFPLGLRRPFVWLGAPVEPGRLELGSGGWVQETVIAFGTTLTVASDDAALRQEILGSAGPTELCTAELSGVPEPRQTFSREGLVGFAPDRLTVCAYRQAAGEISLSYASGLDEQAAAAYAAITDGEQERLRCGSSQEASEWVVLRFEGQDPYGAARMFHEVVLHLAGAGCPRVQLDPGTALTLSPQLVAPWATDGITAVVYGPTGGKGAMIDSFIGTLG
jgi:hypothetical protein